MQALLVGALLCAAPWTARAQLDLELEGEAEIDGEGTLGAEGEAAASEEAGGDLESDGSAEAELEAEASAEEPSEEPPAEEPPAQEEAAVEEAAPERALSLYMAAGLGVGSLAFTRPTSTGVQHLPQSPFAAAEALMRVHIWPAQTFSLEAQIAYQTSLGFALELPTLFALPERVAARAQRVELSIGPRLHFSSDKRGLALAAPIGFALRSLFPEQQYYSPKPHNLGSLFVRPELIVPLGELITLRGGPQLHWLVLTEPSLQREGATGSGYGIGMQAAVQANVGSTFSVALAYHQLHSVIPAAARFEDTERFLTARFGGAL
jgi:hypothetical protein